MRFTGGGLTTLRGYGDTVQMRLKQSIYHVDSNELFFYLNIGGKGRKPFRPYMPVKSVQ